MCKPPSDPHNKTPLKGKRTEHHLKSSKTLLEKLLHQQVKPYQRVPITRLSSSADIFRYNFSPDLNSQMQTSNLRLHTQFYMQISPNSHSFHILLSRKERQANANSQMHIVDQIWDKVA